MDKKIKIIEKKYGKDVKNTNPKPLIKYLKKAGFPSLAALLKPKSNP